MKLHLDVQYACKRADLPSKARIAKWARAALAGVRRQNIELAVRIVGDAEGARLNARWRGKPGPTNVLSFPCQDRLGRRRGLLGDIVICAPLVAREARAQNKRENAHWAHLVVHAIMHLRGYAHATRAAAEIMEAREIRVLKKLRFPDPYRAIPDHEPRRPRKR
ncbi:MAG: rRNA maturation RNase YbeY [Candidatus Muproteobacteria bacterium RBG_16_64_11]|uniref:Endoribonuclease YbeY n=1 Tax=Candidatus Muproteobacteria bacterium RBG_16_64_11 TaxID=1817758 RepID=A0A1F6TA85_9PROT|nr:MAG: rRNA maturation RNase YbeY [Candidatus Muproteobacteria bacterium RBG_16_64_11]